MKKSLLALAVLGAFAAAASAQSSVTIYGKLDQAVGKNIGFTDKAVLDNAGSRLGFKGVEDLGGGTAAIFGIEHRFSPQSGAAAANFWNGYSTVGLKGSFGQVEIGRDYAVAFLMIQNQIDPFGGDTVADLRDVGMRPGTALVPGNVASKAPTGVRFASQVEYHLSTNGFNLGANVAESNVAANGSGSQRPYSLAANYAAGPLFVGVGIENRSGANDKLTSIGARYNFGVATVSAGYSMGNATDNAKVKGVLVGAVVPLGAGDLKVGYAKENVNSVVSTGASRFGIGYHYNLSKRTKLFGDYAHDSKTSGPKSGYDLGIQHNF